MDFTSTGFWKFLKRTVYAIGIVTIVGLVFSLFIKNGAVCGERIGVVEVKGFISDSEHVVEGLKKFENDPDVKAIVVKVNTPGGVVAPSQEMHDAVKRAAERKPIICAFGSVAASGGYYLSAPATKIVANPGTITGSIGVVLQFSQYRALFDKVGLHFEALTSGAFKDTGSPMREMRPDERALMQGVVNDIFNQFVDAVTEGRKLKREKVLQLADGRIYTGRQALENGLVDEVGGYDSALNLAAGLGGLSGEPKVEKWEKKRKGLLPILLGQEEADSAMSMADPLTASPIRLVLPGW